MALQRWARRSPRSGWSRSNKIRLAELEPTGRIQPAGRAVIEAAKASGMWEVFDSVEDLIEPPELAAALDAVPQARAHWDGFPPSARKQGLAQIALAKQPATKSRRIAADRRQGGPRRETLMPRTRHFTTNIGGARRS